MKKRKNDIAIYGDRYHRLNGERAPLYWRCVYCGSPADNIEHYPPISRVSDYEAMGGVVYVRYPCCGQCNSFASDFLDATFLDRVERVKDRMRVKWKRHLQSVIWDEDEIDELGRNLKSHVNSLQDKSNLYRAKIETYGGVDMVLAAIYDIYGD